MPFAGFQDRDRGRLEHVSSEDIAAIGIAEACPLVDRKERHEARAVAERTLPFRLPNRQGAAGIPPVTAS
jgi:hypothetical protein